MHLRVPFTLTLLYLAVGQDVGRGEYDDDDKGLTLTDCMPGAVLSLLRVSAHLIQITTSDTGSAIIPTLQVKNLWHRGSE